MFLQIHNSRLIKKKKCQLVIMNDEFARNSGWKLFTELIHYILPNTDPFFKNRKFNQIVYKIIVIFTYMAKKKINLSFPENEVNINIFHWLYFRWMLREQSKPSSPKWYPPSMPSRNEISTPFLYKHFQVPVAIINRFTNLTPKMWFYLKL